MVDIDKIIQRVVDLNIFEDYPIFAKCKVQDGVDIYGEWLTKEDLLSRQNEISDAIKEKYEDVGRVDFDEDMDENLYITCYYDE